MIKGLNSRSWVVYLEKHESLSSSDGWQKSKYSSFVCGSILSFSYIVLHLAFLEMRCLTKMPPTTRWYSWYGVVGVSGCKAPDGAVKRTWLAVLRS